ncbi:hypothetical protein EYF80_059456 [Liparis tanakae]|uniref:Uncharacterized protein n=1 Tax=Liparis tanakae TaxID=230148 RepID=A0A4Z2EQ04_9TELE|nr:hypothetical protein EYF80_059456 [Liparis tanakae]
MEAVGVGQTGAPLYLGLHQQRLGPLARHEAHGRLGDAAARLWVAKRRAGHLTADGHTFSTDDELALALISWMASARWAAGVETGSGGPALETGSGGPALEPGSGGPALVTGSGGPVVVPGSGGPALVTGSGGAVVVPGSGGPALVTGSGGPALVTGSGGPVVVPGSGGPVVVPGSGGPALETHTTLEETVWGKARLAQSPPPGPRQRNRCV